MYEYFPCVVPGDRLQFTHRRGTDRQTDKQTDRVVQSERERGKEYVIQMTRRNNNNRNQGLHACGGFSHGISRRRKAKTVRIQSLNSGVDLLLTFGLLAYWFEPAPYARLTGR